MIEKLKIVCMTILLIKRHLIKRNSRKNVFVPQKIKRINDVKQWK